MGYVWTSLQPLRYLMKCAALFAVIFLLASVSAAQVSPASRAPESPWAQELKKHPELLAEFGQLIDRLQKNLQFPPPRSESPLLPLLPESSTIYAAFPNYGDVAKQTLTIFRQELQQSSVLRDWWQHGDLATTAPKMEDSLEKFSQLSQYLGDEIVVSATTEGKEPSLLIVAQACKLGLKKFLEQTISELAGKSKPGVHVFDPQELAASKGAGPTDELEILVRPDFVVAASDLATLRAFNTRLDRSSREFASTPFGQRVVESYQGGATIIGAADLHQILKKVAPGSQESQMIFQRSGFADMKYLVWDHRNVAGKAVNEAELSFIAPRHGIASWLAKPAPLGSLDFVSPQAILAGTVVLTNPAHIFDDVKELATASNPNAFAALAQFEQMLKLSLKDDLLSCLAGEITLEVDSFNPPMPEWRAIFKVNDPSRLEQTLTTLLAAAHIEAEQRSDGGITFYTFAIPSPRKFEIGYAIVAGYLIIASSQEAVAEAVRLHSSGESLAKSKKLLASLPPGGSPEASASLYEDPIAMAALQLRQVAPEMAESLAQWRGGSGPEVIHVYGEQTSIRETSTSGALDLGAVLVVAAIAIPNLLRSRVAANEASAVGAVRTVNTAQITYAATYPRRGFAPNLATLGTDPSRPNAYSENHAGLLNESLANDSCTADAWCTKSGFQFRVISVCKQHLCQEYVVLATPVDTSTGGRSFCSTSDGIIRSKMGPSLASPLTASQCRAWPPLQ